MDEAWRVLDGLPPYGVMAVPFSANGHGTHSEGFVVEFLRPASWVGNFQRGYGRLDAVFGARQSAQVMVIAGGQGYVVDPVSRTCVRTFGGGIARVFFFPDREVFSDGCTFEAVDGERLLWRTEALWWDDARLEGDRILGEGYDPYAEVRCTFAIDVATGAMEERAAAELE